MGAVVSASGRERFDVVVVGARLAGCAIASSLARAGRQVLVLDRMAFPSDQLSTHALMPAGTSELARMGALPGILALDPSRVRNVHVEVDGVIARERFRPAADGTDFGVCVPRDLQDVELVRAARASGAEVRERCTLVELRWRAGRVAGIVYRDADGATHEVECRLLVGADGRRSTVAALVGAWRPYRLSRNGRGLVFRYLEEDPHAGAFEAETYYQWREGSSIAFAFPCTPAGRLLVLMMGHRDEVPQARSDPEGYWRRKLAEHPGLAARVAGAGPASKLRSTGETPAFFRASSGPGWALAGDAGHFKDPVTGQGMRDAMFAGRTLAEALLAEGALDDPATTDRATRRWEAERDRECLPAYHFANVDTIAEPQSPILREVVRATAARAASSGPGSIGEPDLSDLFGRARTPQQIVTPGRAARAALAALVRGNGGHGGGGTGGGTGGGAGGGGGEARRQIVARGLGEGRRELAVQRELTRDEFRASATIRGSEHPGASWPEPPDVAARHDAAVEADAEVESAGTKQVPA
ncbi:MAG TPA: NAD(P)/FAD-dependent oxidoreductase [Solirubrobacteraceae bacterium]|jgi:flavin-dependent dehydrogenase